MKLITKELSETFADFPLYSQENEKDPKVIAKFFDPCGSATWFVTEYDPKEKRGFGYVTGLQYDELGYISLEELESIKRPFGLTIERDLYFTQKPLSELTESFQPA